MWTRGFGEPRQVPSSPTSTPSTPFLAQPHPITQTHAMQHNIHILSTTSRQPLGVRPHAPPALATREQEIHLERNPVRRSTKTRFFLGLFLFHSYQENQVSFPSPQACMQLLIALFALVYDCYACIGASVAFVAVLALFVWSEAVMPGAVVHGGPALNFHSRQPRRSFTNTFHSSHCPFTSDIFMCAPPGRMTCACVSWQIPHHLTKSTCCIFLLLVSSHEQACKRHP